MRTRITPNTDTFRAVLGRLVSHIFFEGHHFVIVVNYAQSVLPRVVSGKYLTLYEYGLLDCNRQTLIRLRECI